MNIEKEIDEEIKFILKEKPHLKNDIQHLRRVLEEKIKVHQEFDEDGLLVKNFFEENFLKKNKYFQFTFHIYSLATHSIGIVKHLLSFLLEEEIKPVFTISEINKVDIELIENDIVFCLKRIEAIEELFKDFLPSFQRIIESKILADQMVKKDKENQENNNE